MIKAVLFDIDDTLFDQRNSFRHALTDLRDHYPNILGSLPIDEAELIHLKILNEVHQGVLAGSITIEDARKKRFSKLLSHYGKEVSEEQQQKMRSHLRLSYQKARRATAGAIPFLHALRSRGLRIGVVSNNIVEEQIEKLRICGLSDLIDSVTISEEAGVAKPDKQIFLLALERLGCSSVEVVMIGDSWENDIYPARALGMETIWFNNYGIESPDDTITSINSFEDIDRVMRLIIG